MINAKKFIFTLLFLSACGGSKNANDIKNSLGLNCDFSPIEGSSVISQTIVSGESIAVTCDEDGFHGGGNWYCQYDGSFDGKKCEKDSFEVKTYAVEGFHCDLNEDGVVDDGEDIDFPDHSFVSKWRVEEGGLNIELPVAENEKLDFFVDWGDGKCSRVNNENFEKRLHSYQVPDEYQLRIIGSVVSWGKDNASPDYRNKLIEVIELGDVAWEDLKNAFSDLPNLTSFKAIFTNTSLVTDMASMFQNSDGLSVFDISGITTQLVEDMSYMFSGVALSELDLDHFISPKLVNMEGIFSDMVNLEALKISGLITKNVTTMENLFYGCSNLVNVNFGDYFDTSSVTTMANMFRGTKIVNLDLSFFDTSNVTDMSYMFEGMSELTSINWGTKFITKNVINMEGMFSNLTKITNLDLSHFDTKLVVNMKDMFSGTSLLINIIFGDLFSTELVTNMSRMFFGSGVTSLDIHVFNTLNVIDMSEMFGDTINLININFGDYFITQNVINMYYMFGGSGIGELDLSLWNTSSVTNMARMFYNTINILNINLGELFVTSNVVDMYEMFFGSNISELDLQYFRNLNVVNIYGMFQNTINLSSLNLPTSDFISSNVTDLSSMFESSAVSVLDLSMFDTTSVTDMSSMFNSSNITSLSLGGDFDTSNVVNFSHFLSDSDISGFNFSSIDTTSATDMSFMMANMSNQESFDLSGFDTSHVTTMEGMLEGLSSVSTLDISSFDTSLVENFNNFLDETTLTTTTNLNLGNQDNAVILPESFDVNLITAEVERICIKDLPNLGNQLDLTYFSEKTISLSSTFLSYNVICGNKNKTVTIFCNPETGEIEESGDSLNGINLCLLP